MPLDKMPDPTQYVPTHKSVVLHIQQNPVACIIDSDSDHRLHYQSLDESSEIRATLTGFLNKHEDAGLLLGLQLKIQSQETIFEYVVYPTEEFVDAVIFTESIFIIDEKMGQLYHLKKIITDQFVKTKSEFNKFQDMLK